MISHSFEGECFGPAQALHGCTYVVDAIVEGPKLQTGANYLVDFCPAERSARATVSGAQRALHDALGCYRERNLEELDEFAGENTMCERVARAVWERMAAVLPGPPALAVLRVVVHESDVAHAAYEISHVIIYNRPDCCQERLSPFQVRVGESPGDHNSATARRSGVHKPFVPLRSTVPLPSTVTASLVGT
jgi:6-pyruvoyltetrahydropterin/6-carboxytetrahydropterin synthase